MAGGAVAVLVALLVLWRSPRSVAKWSLLGSLGLLAIEALLAFQTLRTEPEGGQLDFQRWKSAVMGLQLSPLLVFSLSYGRGNARAFLWQWRWILGTAAMVSVLFAFGLRASLVVSGGNTPWNSDYLFLLSRTGTALNVMTLLGTLLVLMNLERTLTASVGTMRWRIKYMVFGVGLVAMLRVYTCSQAILYSARRLSLTEVEGVGLLVGSLLMGIAVLREGGFRVEVYPSASFLRVSFTLILAGAYLLAVGGLAEFVTQFGGVAGFPLKAFLIMAALVGLAAIVFSDRLRQRLRRFISRHLKRPLYDYRQLWLAFAEDLKSPDDEAELCRKSAAWLSEVLHSLSVSVWLVEEQTAQARLAASTNSDHPAGRVRLGGEAAPVLAALRGLTKPVKLEEVREEWSRRLQEWHPSSFPGKEATRLCVPLWAGKQPMGFMILGDRVEGMRWTHEDEELAICAASHVAGHLRTLQLTRRVLQAKEMEAFQTMSTFFVHDLKNATSTLSMMLQNLEQYAGDPAFMADALRSLSRTVAHLEELIGRLGQIRQELRLERGEQDVNEMVEQTIAGLEAPLRNRIEKRLAALPRVRIDAGQMQKVLVNLLLNARDATNGETPIRVETTPRNGGVVLQVSDQGCGMSEEFIARSLFRPFQTTKKKGLGIGMYQSKLIVEGHDGWIEVESQPGAGATFRVWLPA